MHFSSKWKFGMFFSSSWCENPLGVLSTEMRIVRANRSPCRMRNANKESGGRRLRFAVISTGIVLARNTGQFESGAMFFFSFLTKFVIRFWRQEVGEGANWQPTLFAKPCSLVQKPIEKTII